VRGSASAAGGKVSFTIDGSASSDARWGWSGGALSLVGCQTYIGLVQGVGASGAGIAFFQLANASSTGDAVSFWNFGGKLSCVLFANGTFAGGVTCPGATYDPVAHRHLRFRESGGTLTWETSPDATTWSSFGTVPTPSWAGAVIASFGLSNGSTAGPMTTAVFDALNLP
jgi:hypothetical protein